MVRENAAARDTGQLQMFVTVAIGMAMAYVPVIALILARKSLGPLNAATALVVWGAIIPTFEHASFAISGSRALATVPDVGLHSRYHFFMAGIFTIVAGIMIAIIAVSQLRQGKRTGWFAILVSTMIGGGFELSGAAGTLFHGFPPSWAMGLVIYAYLLAWASALAISYRHVFKGSSAEMEVNGEISQCNSPSCLDRAASGKKLPAS